MPNILLSPLASPEMIEEDRQDWRKWKAKELAVVAQLVANVVFEFGSDDGPVNPDDFSRAWVNVTVQSLEKGIAELKQRALELCDD